ncbi:bifunctional NAD(P)H-hydrate repair enzyme [Geotalea uraniireducens]|uniref:Bifunctional NAD(P)H-hydrate repair enzyme n=1 Tax=Geotalea uraniireducens TaxID=351604 RepID=A0ABM8ELE0_9BACT|nr:NAD(P)H-hydrate dehydratase [Geotalea uraniireducens]BDV43379.1 bifunctional NAD(P)H-hydrate repair enzyme [Geotalea uraniireducens]
MKIVTGETMQGLDRRVIDEFGIPGLQLMENAGRGCAVAITEAFPAAARAVVVAGKGNNGGDGYVIARLLRESGWEVRTIVLAARAEIGGDALTNLQRLNPESLIFSPAPGGLLPYRQILDEATVIVDSLLGTGLKNPVSAVYAEAITLINGSGKPVVAVDIPSGIAAGSGEVLGVAVRAAMTVTFGLAKIGHVVYPGCEYCGSLKIVDIGIPAEVSSSAEGVDFVDSVTASRLLIRRERRAHKGAFGHCLIIAGSTGKTGAAAMAANSAVRAGSGLVSLAVPVVLNPILEVKTTEAMTIPLPDDGQGFLGSTALPAIVGAWEGKDSIAIGPGMSWNTATAELVRQVIRLVTAPLVVDADGLNALSEEVEALANKKSPTVVLTPHPGEMARLTGASIAEIEADRLGVARAFSVRYGVYVILKGARTVVAAPDGRLSINGSGNPGMASGGMGDVLTGIVTSLLGQGYEPFTACQLAVFIHGYAADLVAGEKGEIGMSAVDVQEHLPVAFRSLN